MPLKLPDGGMGCRIASCGGDRQLFLWDVGTGKIIRKFKGHNGAINAVSSCGLHTPCSVLSPSWRANKWTCQLLMTGTTAPSELEMAEIHMLLM